MLRPGGRVDRAVARRPKLCLPCNTGLTRDAVETFVRAQLDVAGVVDPLQELLHGFVMARLGGADEVVVGDVERVPLLPEYPGHRLHQRGRLDALRLGRALDLQPVLVGTGEEEHLVAEEAVPAGEYVGRDRRVGVPDVGHVVHVIDRGRDVEAAHGTHCAVGLATPHSLDSNRHSLGSNGRSLESRTGMAVPRIAPEALLAGLDDAAIEGIVRVAALHRACSPAALAAADRRPEPAARRSPARTRLGCGSPRVGLSQEQRGAARELRPRRALRDLRDGRVTPAPVTDPGGASAR